MPLLKTEAPSLQDISKWINSDPLELEDEGLYLLDFWSYTCNNCRARVKKMQEIHEKYPEVTVVGVHTPDFEFERKSRNLEKAVEKLEIKYPVAHDSQKSTSRAYGTGYTVQTVLVHEGVMVYQQDRETGVDKLEDRISEILGTDKKGLESEEKSSDQTVSPYTYFGYSRTRGLNQEGNHPGEKDYELPKTRKQDTVYLDGKWEQTEHYIEARKNSELKFNFRASEANLIIGPNDGIRDIQVQINGEPVSKEEAGDDLRLENGKSYLRVHHPDLYNLVDSEYKKSEITLVPDKKTRFYSFTFR